MADVRRAIWSRFITLTDLEEPQLALAALREFEGLPPESTEDVIRVSHGAVHFALRWGGIREELERHRAALALVERTPDPVVRSGFLQSYGTALNLAARYEEAYELADRQIGEAERFGLDWVRPHGLELRGLAQIGLRHFKQAHADLQQAAAMAEAAGDHHAQLNARALLARIPLAQGSPESALEILEPDRSRVASPGMEGELRSLRALALACLGRLEEAEIEIDGSVDITSHLEARGFRNYASFILAHAQRNGDEWVTRLNEALRESANSGNADCFVAVYRGYPDILQVIRESATLDPFLLRPLKAYDPRLGERAGLIPRATPALGEPLTGREKEVLSLVRQGLSNRQIARALWIAESTVKVHIRHIFDKLGVRSRTAAALSQIEKET
jgi:DNA-binding CsgD family transcriptional regulator